MSEQWQIEVDNDICLPGVYICMFVFSICFILNLQNNQRDHPWEIQGQ